MKIGKNFKNYGTIEKMNRHLLEIGDDVILGGGSKIILHCPISCYKPNPEIIIGDMVYVGYDCAILPSTKIGRVALVGLKSVVTGEVPPYSIYVGNKVIKKREIGEILNYYIIRRLQKPPRFLGEKPTDWKILEISHIKQALGYDTEFCYDDTIDFSLSAEDFVEKYAKEWVEKTT